jgi:aspartate beta-hydroxylase
MDPTSLPLSAERELQAARQQLLQGKRVDAEQSFRRLLRVQPENSEALQFLGDLAQARGDYAGAVNLLSRAAKAEPGNADILVRLGAAYRAVESFDAARYVLERAVRLAPGRKAYARLSLANLLELDQRYDLALLHYSLGLREARESQHWGADSRNAAALRSLVEHARQFVANGRRTWFEEALRPLRLGTAEQRWDRIDRALALYWEGRAPLLADPRQRPGTMYVPDINTAHFLQDARYAWLDGAAALVASCHNELEACVAASADATRAATGSRISVLRAGVLQYEARQHAPQLQRVLAELPLSRVPHQAPDVEIITLTGNSRLAQHYGRSNSRCHVLFNLADGSALEVIVGGEKRVLTAGQTLMFDCSFGVEYANPGERVARALSVEAWHPDLSECERCAVSALIAAAVDFETRLQDLI